MRSEPKADWVAPGEALERILAAVDPLPPEHRPLLEALGYVLAADIVSDIDVPPWNNSAMDGFAVRAADIVGASADAPRELRVVDDVPAGRFPSCGVGSGEAIRVMTGAPVPDGADGVVRVEHTDGGTAVDSGNGAVVISSDADALRNIRLRGEDVRRGQVVLPAGTVLRAAQIAVAAAVGAAHPLVVRRPRVAILASGDELVDLDGFEAVREGRKIVSSNSYGLAAQLAESGLECRVLGIAGDSPESLREHLQRAEGCDALITTAGISVGEHDYVREVLEGMGTEVEFWRVRVRPGSALAFGRVGDLGGIPWFGLPGNPVSTLVTFELFVRPALLRMCGRSDVFLPVVPVTARDTHPATGPFTHLPRVTLGNGEGGFEARLTGAQGSGLGTSMALADALLVVPEGRPAVTPGDRLRAVVLGGSPLGGVPPF